MGNSTHPMHKAKKTCTTNKLETFQTNSEWATYTRRKLPVKLCNETRSTEIPLRRRETASSLHHSKQCNSSGFFPQTKKHQICDKLFGGSSITQWWSSITSWWSSISGPCLRARSAVLVPDVPLLRRLLHTSPPLLPLAQHVSPFLSHQEGTLGRPFWAKPHLKKVFRTQNWLRRSNSGSRIGSVGASCFVDDFVSCWAKRGAYRLLLEPTWS